MKRLWWFGAGYAAGIGTIAWARNKARSTVERYAPAAVRDAVADRSRQAAAQARDAAVDGAKDLGRKAQRLADDVRQAAADGLEAMRRTESDLQADPHEPPPEDDQKDQ